MKSNMTIYNEIGILLNLYLYKSLLITCNIIIKIHYDTKVEHTVRINLTTEVMVKLANLLTTTQANFKRFGILQTKIDI